MTDDTQTEALLPSRETLMAQAQVFASAWAIAGSRFDSGDGMEVAEQEKAILADMTRRLHARTAELEAQLEAIGAGGVSGPLMGQPQAMPDLTALTERGAKAWAGVDAQGLREGRWYMVTHDGVATLCEDRRDAEKEAKDADMAWPHSGPHRAVQLVEASTAGFTAADMATASAQGFRDGGASPSANAGEPSGHIKEPYALAEIKAKIASNDYSAEMLLQHAMLLLDSASLAAEQQAAPKAAPPAFWHVMSKEHGEAFLHTAEGAEHSRQKGHTVTALYTAPTPPTQAQAGAVPLTVSQIREWWASENGLEDCEMCKITDFLRVVRAVEEKHGIKGGLHGAK